MIRYQYSVFAVINAYTSKGIVNTVYQTEVFSISKRGLEKWIIIILVICG